MGKGRVATVLGVEDDGNVKVDVGGGDDLIADSFADGGDDSPPLAGDVAALNDGPETGTQQTTGFDDDLAGVAAPGEKRVYGRTPEGLLAAEIWLKGDGTVVVRSALAAAGGVLEIAPSGVVTVNDLVTISVAGEVTAKDQPSTSVGLTTHSHPTGVGPTGKPIPGT